MDTIIQTSESMKNIKEERENKKKNKKKRNKRAKKMETMLETIENNLKEKVTNKKQFTVESGIQKQAIYKNLTQNYIFYIVLLGCLYAFTKCNYNKSSFILALVSIVFITFYGYIVHFVSHFMGTMVSDMYKTYDNIFTRNKYVNCIINNFIYFMEFHANTHHDTDINKQYKNIALEFINNVVTQGGILIILKFALGLIDNRVILLWAFLYATVHNINYNIVKPTTHKEHHIDDTTNYGIDIWYIIVGSKYDWNNIETHNHMAINMAFITGCIIYLSNRFKI